MSVDDGTMVSSLQRKKNYKWGKMLRKSLGSFPQGRVCFEDALKKDTIFSLNFHGHADLVPSPSNNVIIYKFNSIDDIEKLFQSDKPVTHKKWSLSYGRQNIFSRLVPPLFVSFDTTIMKVKFEGTYIASKFPQEVENYWKDSDRETLRNHIKERLLARAKNHQELSTSNAS